MFQGVFYGKEAADQCKKILILGESHHWSQSDQEKTPAERNEKERSYTTTNVMRDYFNNQGVDPCYRFFEKIVQSFGIQPENRELFWNKVYFGNYVDRLCGIKDDAAQKHIQKNRRQYNDALFTFVNEHDIDMVFCFGRRVFNALPSLADRAEDGGIITNNIFIGKKKDYIGLCIYQPDTIHKHASVLLKKPLYAYSLRHPSAAGGYKPSNYQPVLSSFIHCP